MLLITVEACDAAVTLRFDGRLVVPEARDLVRNWRSAPLRRPDQAVVFDLTALASYDETGVEFLALALRPGDRLVTGAATEAIVAAVHGRTVANAGRPR